MEKSGLPASRRPISTLPADCTMALGSIFLTTIGAGAARRGRRNDTPRYAAKATTNAAIAQRRIFCQRTRLLLYVVQSLEIGHGELEVPLALVLVLFERKRQVHAGAVLGEEGGALGGAPGDRAEAAAV